MIQRVLLAAYAFCGLIYSARAQSTTRQTVSQFVDWFSTSSNIKTSSKFTVYLDAQFRFVDGTQAMQHQIRVGGDFKVSNSFFMMPFGYAYIWNYQYGAQPATYVNDEHRIFQEFIYRHKASAITIQHRLRTEERFIQRHHTDTNAAVIDDGFDNKQFRIRYRIFATIPLTKQADPTAFEVDAKSYYLVVYDELFMSWGEAVTYHEIDQNRIFVGFGYQFAKDLTVQTGYFWQLLVKANGAQQENNMGIGTWLIYNFDLTRK